MLHSTLAEYGFSQNEAAIYLALLELGESLVSTIARRAGQNRVSTYTILATLEKKGIVKQVTRNKVKYFFSITPEQLRKREKQKLEKLDEILPELQALSNTYKNKPKVYFYQGFENTKQIFYDILDNGPGDASEFYCILGTQKIASDFEDFFQNDFITIRKKSHHKTKVIVCDEHSHYAQKNRENHDSIYIENVPFPLQNEIILFDNKIAFLSYTDQEKYALILESKTLYNTLRGVFSLIWNAYNSEVL